MLLTDIQIVLLLVCGSLWGYLALLSVLAFFARKRPIPDVSSFQRFAVIVPAHDEELVIEKTLRSLLAMEYPADAFDVIVVADNCSDQTAELARSVGVRVYERQDRTLQGKGCALRWCFDRLLHSDPGYDALVVVDADTVVSKNFLTVMNYYIANGAGAVQSAGMVEPQPGTWSVEATRVGLTLHNYVRPLGRRVLGCSASLHGNGMCFTADTLRRVAWHAYSLTEDLEYGLELLLNGVPVVFAPEAVVMSTMPQQARNAESQRLRWEAGRFTVIRRYAGRLLRVTLTRPSFNVFDAFVDLVTPPFVNMLVVVIASLLINLGLWRIGLDGAERFVWGWLLVLGFGVVHVVVGLSVAGSDRSMYQALMYLPRYALWKMWLYAKLLRHGQTKAWVRTTREQSFYSK